MGGQGYGAGRSFPFVSDGHSRQGQMYVLLDSLPDTAKASPLCGGYINNYTWFFRPLSRDELFQELLAPTLSLRNSGGKYAVEEGWSHLGLAIPRATGVSGSFV